MQNFIIALVAVLLTFSVSSAQGITTKLDNSSGNNITNINSATSASGSGIKTELNSSDSNYIYNSDDNQSKDTALVKNNKSIPESDTSFFKRYEKEIAGIGIIVATAIGLYGLFKDKKK